MRKLLTNRLWPTWSAAQARRAGEGALKPGPLTPAATLVPLVERPEGLTVLLTQRTAHLHDHAGQISFPGGRVEMSDADPLATALRETAEEIGLAPERIEILGYLDHYETGTGFLVTPVVGMVQPGFVLTLDRFEVDEAFEVPLGFILDPANHRREFRMVSSGRREFYVIEYGERYIWGATAGMLVNLYEKLREG